MVRIIPGRLKSSSSLRNSRSSSPTRNNSTTSTTSSNGNGSGNGNPKMAELSPKENGLTLKVVIMKARNLAAKDRSGTSDPFLVLTLGDSKVTTHEVPKTLNPEWNVIEELPVNTTQSLLLDVICWDKDRFGKDYLGEFDLALEEIFADEKNEQPPKWYPLKSKRPGKKTSIVSGEVMLQFTLFDQTNTSATREQILEKLYTLIGQVPAGSRQVTPTMTPLIQPVKNLRVRGGTTPSPPLTRNATDADQDDEDDDDLDDDDDTPEDDDPSKPEVAEKRKRRLRIKGLKKKRRENAYEFNNSGGDVVGIIYLEVLNITDLPPEPNSTRTTFDMDPFVVASLGKKTYRTKRVRHNLNPVFNEKMIFQVQAHEQTYSFSFTVMDHDKYSGNDFIADCNLAVRELIDKAPRANPENGLYELPEPHEFVAPQQARRFKKLAMSRTSSSQSLTKVVRPGLSKNASSASTTMSPQSGTATPVPQTGALNPDFLTPEQALAGAGAQTAEVEADDADFNEFSVPLKMKDAKKWEDKHNPVLYVRAKYVPYPALRQQFWRSMLKQYDTDESGRISKIELTTMLDTLGSTLHESTIDGFFRRFPHRENGDDVSDLTMDEAVICLEDQLDAKSKPQLTVTEKVKGMLPDAEKVKNLLSAPGSAHNAPGGVSAGSSSSSDGTLNVPELNSPGEEGDLLDRDDLAEDRSGEEHVVEIRECPICHQPRLNKRKDADIITHIATCASQDWRQVNNLVMGGFVTASQAQRKWYSKVITKISYGGYKLGANSANILVQDRITGQINEEKMSVYVRLGIRLLYKGLKSSNMETKRIRKMLKSMSIKQGKKFDDPASKAEIPKFIEFHRLDMSEVLLPMEEFKNFNEFFYRALKPEARPCSAPDRPGIVVSPADCRSVVFNSVSQATNVWIKGREFSIKRLLGDAYPDDVKRFENGALGIFRLAPQDYHRFHIPVDGIMDKPKTIAGEYYTVNPMAIRSALDVYGENVRVLCPIDSPVHGRVMVICVGAMMVGSTVITRKEGEQVKRAEELGYFKFGGSTIVLLFEPGKMKFDDDLVDNSNGALETLVRAGMSIGHSPDEPQWAPDMRKDEKDITEADKKDAKRRIGGSLAGEESSSGDDTPGTDFNTHAASAM
ncbi:Phosphatidylserine decarboxylase proenzyme 3 [Colletotrichum sidae]|uniref:Phosphatidylserine decarboxylase proenzyme 2 n=3 Tax=Colletotrichum orbiculare species complex TaxID=2707354 RepID=N4V831_COLOR|nr:Phosphatidylserine decarboxylase proenzyme 3 [Colletotrichum orbiculare MAFF 240422]TDZ35180.1 Phosphatidylserine decarboxylase proenzyme 3 [Colletotrichum spinosum]TEA13987.1 Phosphatidylserine decarboxylase proenzyme 3 [Colletotrichum sidae]